MPKGRATAPAHHFGLLFVLALVIGVLATVEVWRSHSQATVTAERTAAGLVRLLAEQTERTIQAIDFTLIGMRDALLVAPRLSPNDPAFQAALQERLKSLPYVRALFVIGPDGFITHDTDYPRTPRVSLADRPYFRVHQEDANLGLHVGRPLRSRSLGVWFVSFSRRINNADGSFGGIVVAAIEPRYFERFYEGVSIGEHRVIGLFLNDATLLARTPDYEETIGKVYPDSRVCKLAAARGSGVTWGKSPIDGVPRIVGYRMLAGGSLIVFAGWSQSAIYDSWLDHAALVSVSFFLVWMLAAGLTLLWVKYRRREHLEQARRAQVQRLEMMGRIAGGIAHDLGNTIKIARTTFALLKPSLATQRDAMALVDEADQSLKSAFEIIDRLLAFARRQELSPRATNLGELISGLAPILRQAAGPRIQLDLDVAKRLVCRIDPIHLETALLNLVLNSEDAMPGGGRIVIELREREAPREGKKMGGQSSAASPWAEVVVRDDGSGMSRDVLERVFEPFFTTRAGGSGLGLSQVLGFVQQSSGEVRVESREDGGTTVRLLFPIISPEPAASASPSS